LQLDDVKKFGCLFPFVNISLAKWHYQYLPDVYLGAYMKSEVIIVQNEKVYAKMQLTGPPRPYDATEGLKKKNLPPQNIVPMKLFQISNSQTFFRIG
jgi:hypothetical protein